MAEKFKAEPKVRPTNLPEASDFPTDPVIKIPGDDSDEATFAWCEGLRDYYQEKGQFVSKSGLYEIAKAAGLDGQDLAGFKRQVDDFYKSEAKASKPPKEKKVAAATKTKPTAKKKAVAKGKAPAKRTNPNPSPSGYRGHGDSKLILDKTVRGLKVVASKTDQGRIRVTVNDVPLRGLLRFLGDKKYTPGEAKNACSVLLRDMKDGDRYVAELVQEGHVGVGRKKTDSFGEKGGLPKIDKDVTKLILALPK